MPHPDALNRRVEFAAYVAIIVLALTASAVLAKKILLSGEPTERGHGIPAGTKLSLAGVGWEQSERTLLLVLSSSCRFCTESAPFYRRLAAAEPSLKGVRLVVVMPEPEADARRYLQGLGVSMTTLVNSPPDSVGVSATPTLILVDATGVVIRSWVGKLPGDAEAEVLAHLEPARSSSPDP